MSGTNLRSRFFQLPKYDARLSSRFGKVPTYMEGDPYPVHSSRNSPSSFSPHMVLPPINYKRHEVRTSYDSYLPLHLRKPLPVPKSHHPILDKLLETLPDPHQIPEIPIILTPEQENAILLETNNQLTNFDSIKLRELYVSLTNIDLELTGCISFDDLILTFQRKQIPITEQLLQIIAAQFISTQYYKKVNYEKLLSFLGAALKLNGIGSNEENFAPKTPRSEILTLQDQERLGTPGRVVYYHNSNCKNDEEYGTSYTEKDDPLILRLLENAIRQQLIPMNLESLRISFQRADRLHRGSLSEQQIKDLCYQHSVRIDDSVIEKVIHRCKQRWGGQYDWQQFIHFLEKVQPVQTGLDIRSGKRPHDYIKFVPHPSSSWPQAEISTIWGNPIHQHYNQPIPILKDMYTNESYPHPPSSRSIMYKTESKRDNSSNVDPLLLKLNQLQNEINEMNDKSSRIRDTNKPEEDIFQKSNDHDDSKKQNYYPIEPPPPQDSLQNQPWFDRFMEMADTMYKSDIYSTGHLAENEVMHIIDKYNNMLTLNMKSEDIQNAFSASQRSHGLIDINCLLKLLAIKK